MKTNINIRFTVLFTIALLVGCYRVLMVFFGPEYLAYFTPVGALALFGGASFNKHWQAFLFPILILFLSDVVLMYTVYAPFRTGLLYESWYWTYGSFLVIAAVGRWGMKVKSVKNFLFSVGTAGFAHFLITNFGVWLTGCANPSEPSPFSSNFQGLVAAYMSGVPSLLIMLSSILCFGGILFGILKLAENKIAKLSINSLS